MSFICPCGKVTRRSESLFLLCVVGFPRAGVQLPEDGAGGGGFPWGGIRLRQHHALCPEPVLQVCTAPRSILRGVALPKRPRGHEPTHTHTHTHTHTYTE